MVSLESFRIAMAQIWRVCLLKCKISKFRRPNFLVVVAAFFGNAISGMCFYSEKENKMELHCLFLETLKQNQELQKQRIEMSKERNTIIQNQTNNNSFNLNIFLNEKCKDALNIQDFVNTINLKLSDLEETGRLGYVEGLTNIVVRGLKELDVYKRPIHCSDLKREVLYVKDQNEWTKENNDKERKVKFLGGNRSDRVHRV